MTAAARDDEQRTLLFVVVRRDGCRTALLLLPPCSAAAASAGGHPARSTTAATTTSCHDVFWRTESLLRFGNSHVRSRQAWAQAKTRSKLEHFSVRRGDEPTLTETHTEGSRCGESPLSYVTERSAHTHIIIHTKKFRARIYGERPDATTIRRRRRRHYYTKTCVHATQKKILERRKETRTRRKRKIEGKRKQARQSGSSSSSSRAPSSASLCLVLLARAAAGCVGTENQLRRS